MTAMTPAQQQSIELCERTLDAIFGDSLIDHANEMCLPDEDDGTSETPREARSWEERERDVARRTKLAHDIIKRGLQREATDTWRDIKEHQIELQEHEEQSKSSDAIRGMEHARLVLEMMDKHPRMEKTEAVDQVAKLSKSRGFSYTRWYDAKRDKYLEQLKAERAYARWLQELNEPKK